MFRGDDRNRNSWTGLKRRGWFENIELDWRRESPRSVEWGDQGKEESRHKVYYGCCQVDFTYYWVGWCYLGILVDYWLFVVEPKFSWSWVGNRYLQSFSLFKKEKYWFCHRNS